MARHGSLKAIGVIAFTQGDTQGDTNGFQTSMASSQGPKLCVRQIEACRNNIRDRFQAL
jgi:hypothetical protein